MAHKAVIALIAGVLPGAALGDYVGTLRASQSTLTPAGMYSFVTVPAPAALATVDNTYRVKLGYKPSRFFAVEGEMVDFGRNENPFQNPADLASQFRSTGFGVDTIAMLPVWRFSFYGRMGAYRGDRMGPGSYSASLLPEVARANTRWRYGLGVRYDVTKALGIRAEMERYSLGLGSPFAGDVDSDQITVGLSWRF